MLLQSWSVRPGSGEPGAIRLFPATPWRWHTASFADLRVEGGHRVSARRERNATTWLRVVAGRTGAVRIRDNFGGRQPRWSRAGVRKVGPDYVVSLKAGEVIEATLPRPAAIPPAPADAAPPLQISTALSCQIACRCASVPIATAGAASPVRWPTCASTIAP